MDETESQWQPVARGTGHRGAMLADKIRGTILGDERRLGFWIFPLFVLTALLGATLVGGLAALYYGQQVSELERTTAAARRKLDQAVTEVQETADKARTDIEEQAREVRESLSQGTPIEGPNRSGVYAVSAQHAEGEVRVGSAFTVFSNEVETYLLTSYALVATDDDFAVQTVELFLPDRTVTVEVHSFDAERALAVLVAEGGPLPVLPWRGADRPVEVGDSVYAAGIAGSGIPVVLEGRVAGISDLALVPDLPLNAFLAGGPLLDGSGEVVAVSSLTYAPFGLVQGSLTYAPPIRLVCEQLIACTSEDVGAGGLGDEGDG